MIDYNKNYKLYIDNFNDTISYEEYCGDIIGIIRLNWEKNYKYKCKDFNMFCDMINDEDIIYYHTKLYNNLCDAIEKHTNSSIEEKRIKAIEAERIRILQNKIMEMKKYIIKEFEERNIKLKYYNIDDDMIKNYIEELINDTLINDTLINDNKINNIINNIIFFDDIEYHNLQEQKNKKNREHIWGITYILKELKNNNINKITNETIKEMSIIKLINIYNKIYKDHIKTPYKYRAKIFMKNYIDEDEYDDFDYNKTIDIKATTFKGDNEPLKTIMKRFYIMITKPNDKVLELIEINT